MSEERKDVDPKNGNVRTLGYDLGCVSLCLQDKKDASLAIPSTLHVFFGLFNLFSSTSIDLLLDLPCAITLRQSNVRSNGVLFNLARASVCTSRKLYIISSSGSAKTPFSNVKDNWDVTLHFCHNALLL